MLRRRQSPKNPQGRVPLRMAKRLRRAPGRAACGPAPPFFQRKSAGRHAPSTLSSCKFPPRGRGRGRAASCGRARNNADVRLGAVRADVGDALVVSRLDQLAAVRESNAGDRAPSGRDRAAPTRLRRRHRPRMSRFVPWFHGSMVPWFHGPCSMVSVRFSRDLLVRTLLRFISAGPMAKGWYRRSTCVVFVRMSVPAQDLRMIPAPVRELGSGPPFPEGGGPSAPTSGEPDWRSLFERERRRAEEWRRGEIDWRQ